MFVDSLNYALGNSRVNELRKIGRYNMYDMQYRIDLYQHTKQVGLLVEAMLPFLGDYLLNAPLMRLYAAVHDDPEIYPKLGDVQAAYKAVMERVEREELEALEEEAVEYVLERFGSNTDIGGYTYGQVLRSYRRQITPEAQLVGFLDKVAAFCEAFHEIAAGNQDIVTSKPDPKGRKTSNPFYRDGYPKRTEGLIEQHPFLKELRYRSELKQPFVYGVGEWNYITIVNSGKPHTLKSIEDDASASIPNVYQKWLKVILESGDDELIEALYVLNTRQFANCP